MNSKTLFYDGITYGSSDMASFVKSIVTTGVSPVGLEGLVDSTCLKVVEVAAANAVKVSKGIAFIEGRLFLLNTDETITLQPSDATRNRTDSIVLKMDITAKTVTLRSEMGGYDSSLYIPVRNDFVYELVLGQVQVDAQSSFYTQSNITDTRYNPSLCGISTTPTGDLQNQIDAIKTTLNSCLKVSANGTTYQIVNRKTYSELELYKNNCADEVNTQLFKVHMPNNSRLGIEVEVTMATRNNSGEAATTTYRMSCSALADNSGNVLATNGLSAGGSVTKTSGVSSLTSTTGISADNVNKYVIFAVLPNEEPQDATVDVVIRTRITYMVEGVVQTPGITIL